MSSRDERIRALTDWARRNGVGVFGDLAAANKLQRVARVWYSSTRDETIASYVEAALRILERERYLMSNTCLGWMRDPGDKPASR